VPEPSTSPPSLAGSRNPALDGIRTLAVVAVLLFHIHAPGFGGGFVGVDVFFVLSGFLITGLLLHDIRHHDAVRLARFWTRRFRRLMPAFVVMILAVIGWSATLSLPLERDGLRADALWSLLYVGNWHFIQTASYFESTGSPSPLQHVWSLAVEEQFYVGWPLLVGLVALIARRMARRRGHAHPRAVPGLLVVVAVVLCVGSAVALAVLHDPAAPERAYMGTDARAFEPLAGAALAGLFSSARVRRHSARVATPLVAVGLIGLAVGTTTLGTVTGGAVQGYYQGGAALFTLSAVALVAGTAAAPGAILGRILGCAPMAWLGQISYGIYLWHWPLRVWIIPDDDRFHPIRGAGVAVLSVLLAAASFYLVERPIREGRLAAWLNARRTFVTAAGVLAASVALTGAIRAPEPVDGRSLVFVGDSVPRRLAPILASWTQRNDRYATWQITDGSVGGCPAIPITPRLGDARTPHLPGANCPAKVARAQAKAFAAAEADVVVWWSRAEEYDRLAADGTYLAVGTPQFWIAQQADLRRQVAEIRRRTGAAVVLVGIDRPGEGMRSRCTPRDCHPFLRRLLDRDDLRVAWNRLLAAEARRTPGVGYLEVDDLYCRNTRTPCDDRMSDRTFARPDGSHFSPAAGALIAKPFLDRVTLAAGDARREVPPAP
jgi:peptidoglycan/LPS O-acetylase OafA/YrhL